MTSANLYQLRIGYIIDMYWMSPQKCCTHTYGFVPKKMKHDILGYPVTQQSDLYISIYIYIYIYTYALSFVHKSFFARIHLHSYVENM